jgi:hypothetical protein
MSISLEKVAEKYLVSKRLSAGTRKEYRSTVRKWHTWGQGVDVDEIERYHIRDFLPGLGHIARSGAMAPFGRPAVALLELSSL